MKKHSRQNSNSALLLCSELLLELFFFFNLIQTLLLFKHESKFTEVYKSIGLKLSELNSHWIYFFLRKVDSIL